MTAELREPVRSRAQFRCEYCRLPERLLPYHRFEADHIRPEKFDGTSTLDNLAWSCLHCNRHKGPLVAGHDPDSPEVIRLFNPRIDRWEEHFRYLAPRIEGVSAIGRTTVWALEMNASEYVELRRELGTDFTT